METLHQQGCEVFLECGPKPILLGMGRQCLPEEIGVWLPSLRPGQADWQPMLTSLGELYVRGAKVDWGGFDKDYPQRRKVPLPTYPFQRQRYWVDVTKTQVLPGRPVHPLLGIKHRLADSTEQRFDQILSTDSPVWLRDHQVFGRVVFPGAAYVELALVAARDGVIHDLSIDAPLVVEQPTRLQTLVREDGAVEIFAQIEGNNDWRRYATAQCDNTTDAPPANAIDLATLKARCPQPIDSERLYRHFADCGLGYGPQFQTLQEICMGTDEVLARVTLSAEQTTDDYHLPPMLLDGAFQSLVALQTDDTDETAYLPIGIDRVQSYRPPGSSAFVYSRWCIDGDQRLADLTLCDENGMVLAEVTGLRVRRATRRAMWQMLETGSKRDDLLYTIHWQKGSQDLPPSSEVGRWLILGESAVTAELATQLEAQGQQVWQGKSQSLASLLSEFEENGEPSHNAGLGLRIVLVNTVTGGDIVSDTSTSTEAVLQVVQTELARSTSQPRELTLVTRQAVAVNAADDVDPSQAALWGLGRTVQVEQPQLNLRLIDVEQLDVEQLAEIVLSETESQLALRSDQMFTPRLLPMQKSRQLVRPTADAVALTVTQRGSLDDLKLIPADPTVPTAEEVQVAVRAAGLNFRDVLNVLGAYPGDPGALGGEMAGIITAVGAAVKDLTVGDRVFGISGGCFATSCNASATLLVKMPETVDFASAATVPIPFCTAQAVFELAALQAGEKVLIHAAAGGVGLAAIQLAQALGAEIYATASPAKQNYLRQLGIQHVYNSRTTDFAEQILRDTNGVGVDVILNSLTSEGFIAASLSALAQNGRFVEIGKRDIWSTDQMAQVRPDVAYHILAIDEWTVQFPQRVHQLLEGIAARLGSGELQPLRRRIYPLVEAPAAMRYMQQARHIGKIVFAMESVTIRAEVSYLITGGLGALGLKVCAWLLEQGAKHIVLTSRRAPDESAQEQIASLEREHDCTLTVHPTDVTELQQVNTLVGGFGRDWPHLAGVIHAAGVLDDGTIAEQTSERFTKVLNPKVKGAFNLHQATQGLGLDFFVLYSSAASVLGSGGQSNYATANAFLDGLAQHRRAHGLGATSINWGPWADVGMATTTTVQANLSRQGLTPLQPSDAHHAMAHLLRSGTAMGMVLDVDWSQMSRQLGEMRPVLLSDLLDKPVQKQDSDLLQQLESVPSGARQPLLLSHVQRELQQILGLAQPPDADVGFFDLGMDSLMAVELRNRLQQQLGKAYTVSNTLAFDYPTVNKLVEHLADKLGTLPQAKPKQVPLMRRPVDTDAVAIVGLACRFPGASDKEAYWQLLQNHGDAITEVPSERWDIDAYYDPDPDTPGKMTTRYGGFIEGIDQFDAAFFGISPREAIELDPQQRLLLELSWQALEDAGIAPATLAGSRTGVYIGISSSDYGQLIARGGERAIGQYMGTGISHSAAVGRISYILGLEGPSIAIDTACSSSLVALHQASRGLLNGDCELTLVGGVNAILTPELTLYFSRGRFMAPDGRCKTFDAAADGYVRGEGCGMVVLKRLSDAERDGDRIYAVVRGSAVNQDGASGGLTVPNGPSQQRVIEESLTAANLDPSEVAYVEAHGTGTSLGDPIEIQALHNVLGVAHSQDHPLLVGSVKTNIGHLEAAAGIAGVIKVVLSMQQGTIPSQLHFKTPSPQISWDDINIQVVDESQSWPEGRRIAGVSGFAFQGTNAHVVLEGYESQLVTVSSPDTVGLEEKGVKRGGHLLPLSGKTEAAVRELAGEYLDWLSHHDEVNLANVCFTAATGRSHFEHRAAVLVETTDQLHKSLQQLVAGDREVGHCYQRPQEAFLFTGQGSQYAGMGRQLYETQPVFQKTLDQCAQLLNAYLDKPLLELLYPREEEESLLDQTVYTQPVLFAIEYALARLWQSWGIAPDVVMGHSVGEYVAACVAGVFSLEEGLKLIAARGQLMQQLPADGAMVSVMASEERVRSLLSSDIETTVSIAAINGPESMVLSGATEALESIVNQLESAEIKTTFLQVSHAFHSPLMEPMLAEFEQVARQISYSPPKLKLISNVTGQVATDEIATPKYWCRHILSPVNFAAGMETLHQQGCEIFLECGPKPVLLGMGRQCLPEEIGVWLPSLRPGQGDWQQMLTSLGELYVRGVKVDWVSFDKDYPQRRKVALPIYPFQRQRYWIESQSSSSPSRLKTETRTPTHSLLGTQLSMAGTQLYFESLLSSDQPHYLKDHRVFNQALFPTTAYLEMALAVGHHLFPEQSFTIEDFQIGRGLILPDSEPIQVQTHITPQTQNTYTFEIFSLSSSPTSNSVPQWQLHSQGILRPSARDSSVPVAPLAHYQTECAQPFDVQAHYDDCHQHHIDYGSSFQGLQHLWQGTQSALGQIHLPDALLGDLSDYWLHPAVLDAALQVLAAVEIGSDDTTYLPVAIERFQVYRKPGLELWAFGEWQSGNHSSTLKAQVTLLDSSGETIARVEGLRLQAATPDALLGRRQTTLANCLYEVEWRRQARFGRLEAPEFIPTPTAIATSLYPQVQELLVDNPALHQHLQDLFPQLEQASLAFILQAFTQLGWPYQPGESIHLTGVAQRLGVVPQHQRLLARLLEILSEAGFLQPQQGQWQVLQPLSSPENPAQQISSAFEQQAEWQLLHRCGSQLSAVLRGAIDPVQLVFPGGDTSTATQLYQDSPAAQGFNALVQQVVTTAVAQVPKDRGVRILEIGAGTGGTTSALLPHLPEQQTHYCFTDVGTLFTQKAQARFGDYPFVTYHTLDIEQDPSTQGFGFHQQDVVIAANVLHATQDLNQTLAHVRQLLAPGGMLVLLEATHRQRWVDLIFGLLEGWWRFSDVELRPDYPLLSSEQWQQVLADSGFRSVAVLPADAVGPELGQAVIVAQADGAVTEHKSHEDSWLIFADQQGVAQRMATHLQSQGDECILVKIGENTQLEDLEQLRLAPQNVKGYQQLLELVMAQRPVQGMIHCWSLDGPDAKAMDASSLENASQLGCGTVLPLVQALVRANAEAPRLWIVTQGAQPAGQGQATLSGVSQSSLWGMGKVIALEHPELSCTRIDLDANDSLEAQASSLWSEVWSGDREDQVALRQEGRYVARLVDSSQLGIAETQSRTSLPEQPYRLELQEPGLLDSLQWVSSPRQAPGPGEVEIEVKASGLNFLDIVAALDLVPQQVDGVSQQHLKDMRVLGGECAGEIVALGEGVKAFSVGNTVMALVPGAFGQYVTVNANSVVSKPQPLSLEQAAAIPVNFLTAYYALCHVAQLQAGERILIHAAAGGTGMAAVQIAQWLGAKVFATASPPKWETLRAMGVKHIMNSRTTEFAQQVMDLTAGQGVDVVLNSLTSRDFVARSLSALKPCGRFIEIAKRGVWRSEQMAQERPDIQYSIIDLVRTTQNQPELIQSLLRHIQGKFQESQWQPPPLKVFPKEQVVDAFRYMQRAEHIGKIVVTQQSPPSKGVTPSAEGTYLITGGLGGLGLLVADWLVEHQVKHLVLVSRREPRGQEQTQLKLLEAQGTQVVVAQADVSDYGALERVIQTIRQSHPPLRGIIHAAGVLDDGTIQQQSWQKFATVMGPKVQGAWSLHQLTQADPVEFFVMFSSAASLLGSPGQANHSAANAFLDGLAFYRHSLGLPGQSLNLGAVAQIGEAAERGADVRAQQQGVGSIQPQVVLQVLERLLHQPEVTEVGLVPIDWSSGKLPPFWAQWPYVSDWIVSLQKTETVTESFVQQLHAVSGQEQTRLLTAFVHKQVAQVLGITSGQRIDEETGFFDLGMDSLTSVELRNQLQKGLGASIAATALMDFPNITDLTTYLGDKVLDLKRSDVEDIKAEAVKAGKIDDIAALSQDEALALLAEELDLSKS